MVQWLKRLFKVFFPMNKSKRQAELCKPKSCILKRRLDYYSTAGGKFWYTYFPHPSLPRSGRAFSTGEDDEEEEAADLLRLPDADRPGGAAAADR